MLRLMNIKITDNIAEADFYPEHMDLFGHIVVDLKTEEIIQLINVPGYEHMYPGHARAELVEMALSKDTRKERTIKWY